MKKARAKADQEVRKTAIQGDMTIYQAADLKHSLLESLEGARALEIDLSAVSEIDTAGVQILMLLKKEAQKNQIDLRLAGHSAAVLDVFELANLAAFFGDQIVIQSSGKTAGRSSAR